LFEVVFIGVAKTQFITNLSKGNCLDDYVILHSLLI